MSDGTLGFRPAPPTRSSADVASDSVFYHIPDGEDPYLIDDLQDDADDDGGEVQDGDDLLLRQPYHATVMGNALSWFGFGNRGMTEPDVDPEDEFNRRGANSSELSKVEKDAADTLRGETFAVQPRLTELDCVGQFQKRSPWWIEGWRPRCYMLRDRRLLYYLEDWPDAPLGVLDFSLVRYELHCVWRKEKTEHNEAHRACDFCSAPVPKGWLTFYLKPVAFPRKIFAFRGPQREMLDLTSKIARIIAESNAQKMMLLSHLTEKHVVSQKNFWRFPFMLESSFVDEVQSGDILLFRSRNKRSKVQRAITSASYDHVALLLRTQTNQVLILESTGIHGVTVLPWHTFKAWNWHNCYERLVYRKVYFPRTGVAMTALQDFVVDVIGKPYHMSMKKLLKRTNSREFDAEGREITGQKHETNGDRERLTNEAVPDSKGFFCSELVGACLKRCGVLSGSRAASQYWPGSFSVHNEAPLPLQDGARLGEERVILYDV